MNKQKTLRIKYKKNYLKSMTWHLIMNTTKISLEYQMYQSYLLYKLSSGSISWLKVGPKVGP